MPGAKRAVTINLSAELVAQIEEIKALAATGGHVFSVTQVCAQALGEAISRARAELVAGAAPGSSLGRPADDFMMG